MVMNLQVLAELASSTATKHHSTHVRSYVSTERKSYREIHCVWVCTLLVYKNHKWDQSLFGLVNFLLSLELGTQKQFERCANIY
jgi:hypothetical protein